MKRVPLDEFKKLPPDGPLVLTVTSAPIDVATLARVREFMTRRPTDDVIVLEHVMAEQPAETITLELFPTFSRYWERRIAFRVRQSRRHARRMHEVMARSR